MLRNLFRKKNSLSDEDALQQWEKQGKPVPPPHVVKQQALKEYQEKFHTDVLIETGTFLGDMIEAQRDYFKEIFSIELSEKLYKKALKRFQPFDHIRILHGDSGTVLDTLVPTLSQSALFWLDGHYSGGITALGTKECPVPEELQAIFTSPLKHVILIDDARLFNGTHDYPTIEEIRSIIEKSGKNYSFQIKDDIIRITPNKN